MQINETSANLTVCIRYVGADTTNQIAVFNQTDLAISNGSMLAAGVCGKTASYRATCHFTACVDELHLLVCR